MQRRARDASAICKKKRRAIGIGSDTLYIHHTAVKSIGVRFTLRRFIRVFGP